MKTKTQKQNTGLENRSEQLSTANNSTARQAVEATVAKHSTPTGGDVTPQDEQERAARVDNRLPIDTEARKKNRTLPTPKVLNLLHTQLPAAYRLAEVVGKWVWVRFTEQPAAQVRQQLAQLGFHWNRERQAWQHPCGNFSLGSQADPHEKYSSYRPASIRRSTKTQPEAAAVAA